MKGRKEWTWVVCQDIIFIHLFTCTLRTWILWSVHSSQYYGSRLSDIPLFSEANPEILWSFLPKCQQLALEALHYMKSIVYEQTDLVICYITCTSLDRQTDRQTDRETYKDTKTQIEHNWWDGYFKHFSKLRSYLKSFIPWKRKFKLELKFRSRFFYKVTHRSNMGTPGITKPQPTPQLLR